MEHGRPPLPNFVTAARIARVVGLELWVRCYPAPGQLRDAAHVALISRLLARVPPAVDRHLEAQIQPGDPRAWDLLLRFEDGATVGVAAETRIRDLQALLRREEAKLADSGVTRLVLLVANTKHNRRTLAEAGTVVRSAFPLGTRGIFASVGREEVPTSNGLVVL
jgi:hypothetical protein